MATQYEHSTLGQLAAQDLGVKVTQKEIKDALQVADTAAEVIPQVPVIAAAVKFASEVQNATTGTTASAADAVAHTPTA